jgi:hypothetical protein
MNMNIYIYIHRASIKAEAENQYFTGTGSRQHGATRGMRWEGSAVFKVIVVFNV